MVEGSDKSNKSGPVVFLSLDLEMNQPSEKIIEVGFCVGNIKTEEILYKNSVIINPKEELSPYIIKLTSITQKQVDGGLTILDAITEIKKTQDKYQTFINPVTWGQGDVYKLLSSAEEESINQSLPCFGRRIIDVKTLFVSYCIANNMSIQSGLAKSMSRIGLNFKGKKHRADDDAYNTLIMFFNLSKKLKRI